MLEKINELIEIMVKYQGNRVIPKIFRWRKKLYQVEKINMIHKKRDGNDKIYYFNVSDKANFFRLAFFTMDLSWKLE